MAVDWVCSHQRVRSRGNDERRFSRLSLYLFWKRKLIAGLVVLLVPPIIASTLIVERVDLEVYKQSAFGRYLRTYMTPFMVMARLLGTVVTHLGAWYHRPLLIPLGLVIVLLAWLRGILWPKRTDLNFTP